jgi:WD40-like Beta Propeller Repeat
LVRSVPGPRSLIAGTARSTGGLSSSLFTRRRGSVCQRDIERAPEGARIDGGIPVHDRGRHGQPIFNPGYTARSPETGTDVWAVSVAGEGKPQPVDVSPGNQSQAVLSPDGRSIAYVSDESGSDEVFVREFPAGGTWQISIHGGTRPRWRADGRELFFMSAGHVMAVDLARESELTVQQQAAALTPFY